MHCSIPQKKDMQYSISNDLHCLLEVCVQIADARSVGSTMLARHEFEFNIQKYELNIKKLREERAGTCTHTHTYTHTLEKV